MKAMLSSTLYLQMFDNCHVDTCAKMERPQLDAQVISWAFKYLPVHVSINTLSPGLDFMKITVLSSEIGTCSNFSTGLMILSARVLYILHLAAFFHPFPPWVEPTPVVPYGQIWQVQGMNNKLWNMFFQLCHLAYRRTLA